MRIIMYIAKKNPNAEWRLMDFLWDKNPATIADIVHSFEGITNWDRHVVIMMLKRMEHLEMSCKTANNTGITSPAANSSHKE